MVESISPTEVNSMIGERFYVIAGSFKNKGNAIRLNKELMDHGYAGEIFESSNEFFRVSISGHASFAEAKRQLGEYKVNRPGEQYWILEK